MQYMVAIKAKSHGKDNNWFYYHDSVLAPNSDFDSIMTTNCDELGLCEKCIEVCDMNRRCHVMRRVVSKDGEYYDKLCPILFCDLVRPPFKVEDLV